MISTIYGTENSYPSTSATNYNHISTSLLGSWNATVTARDQRVPGSFTLSDLYVLLDVAPGSGKSWQFDVMKNGSTTGVTVTISDTSVDATDSSNSVSFSAGDSIALRSVPSGTPTTGTNIWWNVACDGTGFPILGSNTSNASNSAVNMSSPMGVSNTWGTSLASREILVPTAGTMSNLYVAADGTPGGSASYALEVYKNGSTTGLVATISGANTTANDTTHNFTVAAGDRIVLQSTPSSTPTARNLDWGFLFTPDVDGESFMSWGGTPTPSNSATRYEQPHGLGGNSWNATERQVVIGAYDVTKQYVRLDTASGAAKSWDFTLRKNASDTSLSTNLANTTTGNTTSTVTFAQGDKVALKLVPNSTPTLFTGAQWAALIYVPTNQTVTPGVASLTITAQTPTVFASDNKSATPGTASLSITAQTPTVSVSDNKIVALDVASLSLTAQTPSVAISDNQIVTPGVASLSLTAQTPTVSATANQTVEPGTASLSLTAQAPTVNAGDNISCVPGTASLSLTAQTPTVTASANQTATPGTASLTLTNFGPTVSASNNQAFTPGITSLTLTAQTPTVTASAHVSVTPGSASIAVTAQTPTVTATNNVTATPGVASLTLTLQTPTIAATFPSLGTEINIEGTVTTNVAALSGVVTTADIEGSVSTSASLR